MTKRGPYHKRTPEETISAARWNGKVYTSQIYHNHRPIYLGRFATKEDAWDAYKYAESMLNVGLPIDAIKAVTRELGWQSRTRAGLARGMYQSQYMRMIHTIEERKKQNI